MTVEHWAVDDNELHDDRTAEFEVIEGSSNVVSALCEIDYYSGEQASATFSIEALFTALDKYRSHTDRIGHVVVKVIESYNVSQKEEKNLLVLTDETDSTVGIVLAPRLESNVTFTKDYSSLLEKHMSTS